jgi:hypothetical protein
MLYACWGSSILWRRGQSSRKMNFCNTIWDKEFCADRHVCMCACVRVLGEGNLTVAAWIAGVSNSEHHMRLQFSINRNSLEISLITTLIVVHVSWVTWVLILQVTCASSSPYSKETYAVRRCRLEGELKRWIDSHDHSRGRGCTLLI